AREARGMGPWSGDEVGAALLMSPAIGWWVTDFLHQIPAPMIRLGIGLLAVMPRIGVLDTEDLRKINYLPIFFVAAAVRLSNVLADSKALDVVTAILFSWIQSFIGTSWIYTLMLYSAAFRHHIRIGN